MRMPGFAADHALPAGSLRYRDRRPSGSHSDAVIPALPPCRNCDYIIEQCEKRGDYHSALCRDCMLGYCSDY